MKNLKIRVKLVVIFTILMFFFALSIREHVVKLEQISNEMVQFKNEAYDTNEKMWEVQNYTTINDNLLEKLVDQNNSSDKEKIIAQLEENSASIADRIDFVSQNLNGVDTQLQTLQQYLNELKAQRAEIQKCVRSGDMASAKVKYDEYILESEKAQQAAETILEAISANAENLMKDAQNIYASSIERAIVLTVFIAMICVLMGLILSSQIRKPIQEIKEASSELARGNLNAEIKYTAKDEMGELAQNMRETIATLKLYIKTTDDVLGKMAGRNLTSSIDIEYVGEFDSMKKSLSLILDSFNSVFTHIREAAEQTKEGADNIAKASEALAEASTEQSSAVEELVATVNEVDEHVNKNAENANKVKELSSESVEQLTKGNEQVQQLLSSMDYISEQSKEISNIIKIIENISSSTNLLSLNASIEAARAGEYGKGFSVVANEIGKLASDCSIAAQNISELISTTLTALAESHKLTNETAEMIGKTVEAVSSTDSYVSDIALACNQQAESLDEILKGIQQISAAVETNSATAQETSAASQQLLSQSDMLAAMLEEFKLR